MPTNGNVFAPSTTFGSTATHTCNIGFLLCGENNRTCQSNGSWSGSTPDCISKYWYSVMLVNLMCMDDLVSLFCIQHN